MTVVSISLDKDETKILEKRAKKNLFTLKEQVQDIIRRSCVNTSSKPASDVKCDDNLVSIFSRSKKGRKKK